LQLSQRLTAQGLRTIGYALQTPASGPRGCREFLFAENASSRPLRIDSSWGKASTAFRHVGGFNVANALAVAGALLAHGIPFAEAVAALASLPAVPGRMQQFGGEGVPLAVVDYAHTPDALEKVLQALRPLAAARGGRLIAVFGAGGERDAAKRPLMGAVAARLADRVLLTSDNPRGEDPAAIIEAIRDGMPRPAPAVLDRAQAIEQALHEASERDVVLVAGKGHESYQEAGGRRLPFSDAAAVRAALERRSAR
jgi:UDP-N-acetylmuramoyl-L-alanyl-D-glutamate--2,6-diaminopimelate ligase